MLGRALDAAADQQRQLSEERTDSKAGLPLHSKNSSQIGEGYGSIEVPNTTGREEVYMDDDEDDSSYEEEEEDSFNTEDEEELLLFDSRGGSDRSKDCSWCGTIRRWILLVANVDNLWDNSPNGSFPNYYHLGDEDRIGEHQHPRHTRRQVYIIVSFWFGIMSTAYAVERTTFKLLVDRAGPFRLFSAQVITALHTLLMLTAVIVPELYQKWRKENRNGSSQQSTRTRSFWKQGLGIPIVDLGIMALMDTVHLILVVISGAHVPPTLTVILIQLTIPLTGFFSQFLHPDGFCKGHSNNGVEEQQESDNNGTITVVGRPVPGCGGMSMEHLLGSLIITCAVLLGMIPATASLFQPEWFVAMDVLPIRTAVNTWVYLLSCIPAALSQLYKEYSFLQHKQPPADACQLNGFLSLLQLIFLAMVSPLVYGLQGLMGATTNGSATKIQNETIVATFYPPENDSWMSLYPSSQISENFRDGWKCFWGVLDEETELRGYPEYAECGSILVWIVLAHVVSIALVGVAVDKIFKAGATKIMFRGISIGIVLAVIAMYTYDMNDQDFNYGPLIDSLWLLCTVILILGAEVYHRVTLTDATFETVHPTVDDAFFGDDNDDDF